MSSAPSTNVGALPCHLDEITARWLDSVIADHSVVEVELGDVVVGSTTKVFVRARLDDDTFLPLCVKGLFDEPRLPVRVLAAQQEARFFAELAPTLAVPLFRTWFSGTDEHQGIVVFDDLRSAGTTFTDVGSAWDADQVAAALEAQAAWHASTWDYPAAKHPWLPSGNLVLAAAADQLFSEGHWSAHFAGPDTVQVPTELADRQRMDDAIRCMFALQAPVVHALSHGDAHIGNTYVDAAGQPGFYDWQTFCLAPPLDDVSYFIGGAMTTEDRRANEQDLLRHYLSALSALGAPAPSWNEAWLAYRRYQIHGFFWAVLPTDWQPAHCRIPMAERYIAAIQDHETLSLLR